MRRRSALGTTVLLGAMVAETGGCGYILYPERRGRSGGNLDVGVTIMDALWLLVFLIPGIIAFVVDFSTGCIYVGGGRSKGERIQVLQAGAHPDRARIEAVVSAHLGRRVDLTDPRVVSRRLASHEEIRPALSQ